MSAIVSNLSKQPVPVVTSQAADTATPVQQPAPRVAKPLKRHAPSSSVSVPPNDDNSDTDKCVVCYDEHIPHAMLLPCRHKLCYICAAHVKVCAVCRLMIKTTDPYRERAQHLDVAGHAQTISAAVVKFTDAVPMSPSCLDTDVDELVLQIDDPILAIPTTPIYET